MIDPTHIAPRPAPEDRPAAPADVGTPSLSQDNVQRITSGVSTAAKVYPATASRLVASVASV
jgi:hypothetical protein